MELSVNRHSSIRIGSDKVIYFDPYLIDSETHDADIIFITHEHFDHFSVDDIKKVEKEDTVYVIPDNMYDMLGGENVYVLRPNEKITIEGHEVITLPSYNVGKPFHPKDKGNLAYIVTIEGKRVFVAGDCDMNEDNSRIRVDIAFVPVGGKYTMDYREAAALVNRIRPELAIPVHYGEVAGDRKDGERFRELVDKDIKVELLLKE